MGLDVQSILDPLDLGGRGAAEASVATAQANAELLREFSDITQENLQPFLDLSNRQLAGLEESATLGGFFNEDDTNILRSSLRRVGAPIVEERTRDLTSSLGQTGKTRSGFAAISAADIQEDVDLSLLLQLQSSLQGRRQTVAGFGSGTGSNLARFGQQSAEELASIQSQGFIGAGRASAAGTQNFVNLAGLGAEFLNRPPTPAATPPPRTQPISLLP